MKKELNEEFIRNLSNKKNEPEWMLEFRLKSYKKFLELSNPSFGPKIDIDFSKINYYKSDVEKITSDWKRVNCNIRNSFDKLGVIEAEEKYLGGVTNQFESEVVYHNQKVADGVIFTSTDEALKKYPDLFKEYFNSLVKYDENKYTALNGAVWSGGSFIYVPKGVKVDRPLQSYFRIETESLGQFERTIIIVDEGADLSYIEGCTATQYSVASLHAGVVEIFVKENGHCRYSTIQNWSTDVYNLVTKRSIVEKNYAKSGQFLDAGAKMIHLAPNTKSNIVSKSIAEAGGISNYRGTTRITKNAINSKANVKCDTIILDEKSKSDTFPKNIVANSSSILEHEATISKMSQEKMFYLTSKGLSENAAKELLIMGFISDFKKELPMEYAVELNRLLKE